MDNFRGLFDTYGLTPHGFCYAWQPELLWPMVLASGTVALAYFSIPIALLFFLRRLPTLRYRGVFVLFSAFIFFCGMTHVVSVVNIWVPIYRFEVVLMVMTAAVSVATAIMLWPLLPRAARFIEGEAAVRARLEASNADLSRALEELSERNRTLDARARKDAAFSRLEHTLQSCITAFELRAPVQEAVQTLLPGVDGAIYAFNGSEHYLERVAGWGGDSEGADILAPDDCWSLRQGRVFATELGDHDALRCPHLGDARSGSALCLPMSAGGEVLGFLHLRCTADPADFSEAEREARRQLALDLADRISINLANIRLRERLRGQSVCDPLTGLFNRRYFEETLDRELKRAIRAERKFALLVIDIDHFKTLNDTAGHAAGDDILRQVSIVLREHCRGSDVACRFGGDEFVVALFDIDPEQALARAEILRDLAGRIRAPECMASHPMSISIGIACYPDDGSGGEELIAAADRALYRAKLAGRNRICVNGGKEADSASRLKILG